ncbi:MAG: DsbE family thiol:disulfide interchange protein [Cardiobacteriaceae bacterium]|nr:DsbE family thiol:disulfide interchange protein [Cardiobacteriaceae bacterium]
MTTSPDTPSSKPRVWKRLAWALAPFLALIILFAKGLDNNPQALPSTQIGKALPSFSLPNLEGKALSNADLPKQTAFLVNVWGSWCPACYEEHPFLLELSKTLPIVGVNWGADNPNEIQDAQAMLARHGNPYQLVVHDGKGALITDLGVYGAPETFVINQQGHIVYRHAGPLNQTLWEQTLKPLLEKP